MQPPSSIALSLFCPEAAAKQYSAAMRSIVRRDTGESYDEFLTGLARASGIGTPTREQLARLDRKRKKRTSNQEWMSPTDTDARVTKMKVGARTWRIRSSTRWTWTQARW
jgi:hypothetical protein